MPKMKHEPRLLALDTETTGLDFYHGCRPFFVTACDNEGTVYGWEWDVDPETREVDVIDEDIEEIRRLIANADRLVFHNAKFDATALAVIGVDNLPWDRVEDTMMASHLLHSNQPKDLTTLGMNWVGEDIQCYEKALEEAVKECRRQVQQAKLAVGRGREAETSTWRIGSEDDPLLPSAKSETWRGDYWLPRATAKYKNLPKNHTYWTVLKEYALQDSQITLAVWLQMSKTIDQENLTAIYRKRMECLPIAYDMQRSGLTLNAERLETLREDYRVESVRMSKKCVELASSMGHELVMPKGASLNNSVRTFVYDYLKLDPVTDPKKGNVTLNAAAIEHYLGILRDTEPAYVFLNTLQSKRKRDSSISYMDGYARFWLPLPGTGPEWRLLHPNLNPVGTDTLRWSSNNPNEQNISKKGLFQGDVRTLRYLFGPPPGKEWWSFDAKNMELRIPGYESGQRELIDLFERPDDPPYYGSEHLLNFSVVYPDIWERELKEVGIDKVGPHCKKKYETTNYHWTKCGGFAMGYGAVDRADGRGTADVAFRRPGSQARLKSRFANKEKLNQRWINHAERYGYVETIPDQSVDPDRGYRIWVEKVRGRVKPTQPLNYHVQSTAMWWTMMAMIRVEELFRKWRLKGFNCRIVLQVHDELVVEMPKRGNPKTESDRIARGFPDSKISNLYRAKEIQKIMERGGDDIGVKTPTGCEYHPESWSEGISF